MLDLLLRGGPFMWPIILCSVLTLAIALDRAVCFWRSPNRKDDLLAGIKPMLQAGDPAGAETWLATQRGPVAAVLRCFLANRDLPAAMREDLTASTGSGALRKLQVRLRGLNVIGRIAPLLGLLGTVAGLVQTFVVIADSSGRAEISLLAGGIWQALLTTVAGLMVAIPAIILHDFFEARVDEAEFAMTDALTHLQGSASDAAVLAEPV